MKKLLIGLLALGSITTFADCQIMKLRVGNTGSVSNETLNILEAKGYTINPTYISNYRPYMEDDSIDEGYHIVILEQEQQRGQGQQQMMQGKSLRARYQNTMGKIGTSLDNLVATRTKIVRVRKISKARDESIATHYVSNSLLKETNKLILLSKRTEQEKVVAWGLKKLASCEEAKKLNIKK